MKRVLGLLILVGLMAGTSPVFASSWSSYFANAAEGFYMGITSDAGIDAAPGQMTFDLDGDTTPWLHVHKDAGSSVTIDSLWWAPSAGDDFYDTGLLYVRGTADVWLQIYDWEDKQEAGLWQVDARAFSGDTMRSSIGSVMFRVAPEPVSAGLFLLGGLGLLGGRAVRRKRA